MFATLLVPLPLWVALGCDGRAEPPASGTSYAGYVDDGLCADCHGGIATSYREVGMARSLYPASAGFLAGDGAPANIYHAPSQRHYETFVRDGWLHVRRYQIDERGGRRNVFEQRLDWVIGSGNHVRSYAFATPSGELFAAPLNYYAEQGTWAMAPGYDSRDHFGFTRPIPRACMFCHNAYHGSEAHSDRFGDRETFPANLPHGIGCQRCHGPGKEHVELASGKGDDAAVRRSITNPGRLPQAQRDDVCLQCHLQPTAKLESRQVRFGRDMFSYRPGQPLRDYLVALEFESPGEDGPAERFQINHHPYRLRQSRCFTESEGRLVCTTCHDPHRKRRDEEAAAHYRTRCLSCHTLDPDAHAQLHGGTSPADCVGCHMPTRRPHDVVHALVTDHRIERRPLADPTRERTETGKPREAAPRLYGSDHGLDAAEAELYLLHTRVREGNATAIDALAAALARAGTQQAEPYLTLAHAQHARGDARQAEATLRAVLARDPRCVAALVALGSLRSLMGEQADAADLLRHALELDPQSPEAHHELAETLRLAGRPAEGLPHAETATRLRPVFVAAWLTTARVHVDLHARSAARAALVRASEVDPGPSAPYEALAALQAEDGERAAALDTLRIGARFALDPRRLEISLTQSLLLGSEGNPSALAEGLRLATDHARARAADPEAGLLLALALLLADRPEAGERQADVAERAGADTASCALLRAVACATRLSDPVPRRSPEKPSRSAKYTTTM